MQAKALLLTLFVALAAAAPSQQEGPNLVLQGTYKNPEAEDSNGGFQTLAQKNWQAAGGCKRDWDEDNRCLNQCIGEANSKCPRWRSMTAVIQGGCLFDWNTCRCICEY
ncbi:hypothetical protein VTK26DRAFT_426 [Humicola hyalothermophila]